MSEWYVYTNVHLRRYAPLAAPRPVSVGSPMARVDMYGIVIDPSKRLVPGFAVNGDGGVDP